MEFEWDDENSNHVAAHGFAPSQAQEVLENEEQLISDDYTHTTQDGESRYLAIGFTNEGLLLAVVYTVRGKRIRPISAFVPRKRKDSRHGKTKKNKK